MSGDRYLPGDLVPQKIPGTHYHYCLRIFAHSGLALEVSVGFLAALVSLALDCIDMTLRSSFDVSGVAFVSVDVHGKFETRIHPH